MEVNFYIWLVLTIVVTVYVGILIVRWQKKQDAKKQFPKNKITTRTYSVTVE